MEFQLIDQSEMSNPQEAQHTCCVYKPSRLFMQCRTEVLPQTC
jgi:hypothetical protein